MPNIKWLTGSFVSLIALALCRASATPAAVGNTKTISPITGWCLLVPPFFPTDPPGRLQLGAPLSDWTEMDSTKTAADCEEQRDNMTRMYRSGEITSLANQFEQLLYHYAVCASSVDPRLKGATLTAVCHGALLTAISPLPDTLDPPSSAALSYLLNRQA